MEMELSHNFQPQMAMKTEPELDDDVFYAELRRQILVLTAEDDDDAADFPERKRLNSEREIKQGGSGPGWAGSYFSWMENDNTNIVPAWLVNLWRHGNGNGTGVFIPRIAKSRRRQKQGRRNKDRGTIYRPVANKNECTTPPPFHCQKK